MCRWFALRPPTDWGLRKYAGLPDLIWGGDPNCGHQWEDATYKRRSSDGLPGFSKERYDDKTYEELRRDKPIENAFCSKCSAWRGAYGLEPQPEMYVQHTIEILREIRRVLRKDGVVFWNIGDSYISGAPTGKPGWANTYGGGGTDCFRTQTYGEWTGAKAKAGDGEFKKKGMSRVGIKGHPYLKPKDLCLIPFRVAISAQEDGWWVRSVIIWNKPNPMPESVTDRPTESHEYILMLTKSARYYWDADAVREPLQPSSLIRAQYDSYSQKTDTGIHGGMTLKSQMAYFQKFRGMKTKGPVELLGQEQHHGQDINNYPSGRNLRSVWEFSTQSFAGAHSATFPEKLPEICIRAATPEVGCCSKCGKPWVRITEQVKANTRPGRNVGTGKSGQDTDPNQLLHQSDLSKYRQQISYETLGWQPTCKCNAPQVPSIVLDPFAGSCTTLAVAKRLGRGAIGYELSAEYCKLGVQRIEKETAPFPNLYYP